MTKSVETGKNQRWHIKNPGNSWRISTDPHTWRITVDRDAWRMGDRWRKLHNNAEVSPPPTSLVQQATPATRPIRVPSMKDIFLSIKFLSPDGTDWKSYLEQQNPDGQLWKLHTWFDQGVFTEFHLEELKDPDGSFLNGRALSTRKDELITIVKRERQVVR